MAKTGQWADHNKLADLVSASLMPAEDAAAAIRDFGDRLDKAEAELHALLNVKDWKGTLDACGAGQKSAYLEAARLAEEAAKDEIPYEAALEALAKTYRHAPSMGGS